MKESYNILFAVFSIIFIVASIFSVYADSSNSSNSTNTTNTTNVTRNLTGNAVVQPMSIWVSVSETPTTINFGSLNADGTEHTYTSATNVTVSAIGLSASLYTSVGGNFVSSSDTIPVSNFKYSCSDASPAISKTSFTTTPTLVDTFSYFLVNTKTYRMNYYLTVPVNTQPGTYSTTVIYTAS
ncbi:MULTISPECIES: hypothetical protein [Methanobacterium]|uniref:Uncharacterized protein n=1 Tax=Methanobacterium bryantii TaxID=2161 RepID=A0A2A2HA83_METBR|nr:MULTISPECIES: hypothetical protein [Methanobacterium]OEC87099.1 hypothetical protein A9507_09395 [Methanobacterium sp. A39]PAV06164.1 hypothetical protein ASJ80_15135 [Methanobacterium bryantii]